VQLLKNFPALYVSRRLIFVFTKAFHRSLYEARSVQSIPAYPTSLTSVLTLSTHLSLRPSSGLFRSGFPTNTVHAFLCPISATCFNLEHKSEENECTAPSLAVALHYKSQSLAATKSNITNIAFT
jgi:hypothetical protein